MAESESMETAQHEIGERYGRTEQSISGWVRQALREMKLHF
jgi:hypothetical protein